MFENLSLIGGIVILLWLLSLLLYFRTSGQHRSLHNKVDALNKQLDQMDR